MSLVLTLAIVFLVLALVAVLFLLGSYRIRRLVAVERNMIIADVRSEGATPAPRPTSQVVERLPGPVRRYLEKAGAMGNPPARFVHVRQKGEFRMNQKSAWSKMRAEQWFNAIRPAFVWHAAVSPFPLFWVEGRDSFVQKKGSMIIRLMSTFTVVNARGPEMDVSSLVRYLSEAPWFPSALLPSERMSWAEVDDRSARATLRDGELSVSMEFTFNERDEIVQGLSEDRFGEDNRKQPWIVRYGDYKEFDGFRIPTTGEAAWKTQQGEFVYVRVRIAEVVYPRPS